MPTDRTPRPLTPAETEQHIRRAFYADCDSRWGKHRHHPMPAKQFEELLALYMGELHGWGGPGMPWGTAKGNGFRIWASWSDPSPDHTTQPILAGAQTVAAARRILDIPLTTNINQLELF